jgi:hypothetical protein
MPANSPRQRLGVQHPKEYALWTADRGSALIDVDCYTAPSHSLRRGLKAPYYSTAARVADQPTKWLTGILTRMLTERHGAGHRRRLEDRFGYKLPRMKPLLMLESNDGPSSNDNDKQPLPSRGRDRSGSSQAIAAAVSSPEDQHQALYYYIRADQNLKSDQNAQGRWYSPIRRQPRSRPSTNPPSTIYAGQAAEACAVDRALDGRLNVQGLTACVNVDGIPNRPCAPPPLPHGANCDVRGEVWSARIEYQRTSGFQLSSCVSDMSRPFSYPARVEHIDYHGLRPGTL